MNNFLKAFLVSIIVIILKVVFSTLVYDELVLESFYGGVDYSNDLTLLITWSIPFLVKFLFIVRILNLDYSKYKYIYILKGKDNKTVVYKEILNAIIIISIFTLIEFVFSVVIIGFTTTLLLLTLFSFINLIIFILLYILISLIYNETIGLFTSVIIILFMALVSALFISIDIKNLTSIIPINGEMFYRVEQDFNYYICFISSVLIIAVLNIVLLKIINRKEYL